MNCQHGQILKAPELILILLHNLLTSRIGGSLRHHQQMMKITILLFFPHVTFGKQFIYPILHYSSSPPNYASQLNKLGVVFLNTHLKKMTIVVVEPLCFLHL
ncbi:hypothetical protein LIER_16252 [Lithospermum erythrorhizon]|uniref:Uncharacterized protein n=1 Tax=Lithospermum erythrorhizon TaxID=34254 RepID=A0AAV3QBA5_LITER